jgi:uncharacterized protein YxeA
MKKTFIIIVLLVASIYPGYSKVWKISDSKLEVRFDDQTGLLSVTDKRCNKVWEQSTVSEQFTITGVSQKGNSLNVGFSGKYAFEANFTLNESSALQVSLTADSKLPINELTFPSSFKTPGSKSR